MWYRPRSGLGACARLPVRKVHTNNNVSKLKYSTIRYKNYGLYSRPPGVVPAVARERLLLPPPPRAEKVRWLVRRREEETAAFVWLHSGIIAHVAGGERVKGKREEEERASLPQPPPGKSRWSAWQWEEG